MNLKGMVHVFGLVACVMKFFRHILPWSHYQVYSLAGYFIEQILYWFPEGFIFAQYCLLLVFWVRICRKNNVSTSWAKPKTKIFLFTADVAVFFLLFLFVSMFVYDPAHYWIANFFLAGVILILAIGFLVSGVKVKRLLTTSMPTNRDNSAAVRKINVLTMAASVGFLVTLFVLVFDTIIEQVTANFTFCQTYQLLYRICELSLIFILTKWLQPSKKTPSGGDGKTTLSGKLSNSQSDGSIELPPQARNQENSITSAGFSNSGTQLLGKDPVVDNSGDTRQNASSLPI